MRKELLRLLQAGEPLNENRLAGSLFKSLENRNFDLDGYSWVDIATLPLEEIEIPQIGEDDKYQDMLFKDILIKGIKKFPAKGEYYRLAFAAPKSKPSTTVIMGVNGAGKSSFFGALEMIGMGQMNTARLHGMDASSYIRHLFATPNEIHIKLNTSFNVIEWTPADIKPFVPPAFFISEWDIRQMEPLEDFGEFIYEQLGLKDFNALITHLENTRRIIEENLTAKKRLDRDIESLKKEIERINQFFHKGQKKNKGFPLIKKKSMGMRRYAPKSTPLIDDLNKRLMQCISKEKEKESNEVYMAIERIGNVEGILSQLIPLIDVLNNQFKSLVEEWTTNYIRPIVKRLLDDYLKDDDIRIEISFIAINRKIAARLIKNDVRHHNSARSITERETTTVNQSHTQPRAYFNTFRFKMFAVSLKIACACCAKIIYKKSLPILIDDVFNTSDFNNRQKMGDYIKKIYTAYNEQPQLKEYPLQLILFTQDDFIATSVFHGLEEIDENVRLLRLHDYKNYSVDTDRRKNDEIADSYFIDVFSVAAQYPPLRKDKLGTIKKRIGF